MRVRLEVYLSGEHLNGLEPTSQDGVPLGRLQPYSQMLDKGGKGLQGTNSLAYQDSSPVTKKKKFVNIATQVPRRVAQHGLRHRLQASAGIQFNDR